VGCDEGFHFALGLRIINAGLVEEGGTLGAQGRMENILYLLPAFGRQVIPVGS
jgi:hypothetical protein